MNRRRFLAATSAVGAIGLSGCLGTALKTVTSLESTPAAVEQSALDSTDYEQIGIEEIVTEEDVEVAGQSETITVTSYLTEYEKRVGIEGIAEQATATFSILSTPKIEIAGRTFNPVAEMSTRELVDLIADSYEEIENIESDGDETVTVLEQEVTKTRFVADASLNGVPLELDIHVTEAVERGDDLLVPVGVYPTALRSVEAETIRELVEAVSDEPAEDSGDETNESDDGGSDDEDDSESSDDEDSDDGDSDDEDDSTNESDDEDDELLGLTA
ncbi:MAG: DUF6517 family protein [Halohasta sp.]